MADPVNMDALAAAWRAKCEHYAATGITPSAHMSFFDGYTAARGAATDEVDRLRGVLENAPHDDRCPSAQNEPGLHFTDECTCWKAEAP